MNPLLSKVGRWAVSVGAVIVGVLLAVVIITATSRAPGHDELFNKQIVIEEQLRVLICLSMISETDRTPEAIAACQVPPDE